MELTPGGVLGTDGLTYWSQQLQIRPPAQSDPLASGWDWVPVAGLARRAWLSGQEGNGWDAFWYGQAAVADAFLTFVSLGKSKLIAKAAGDWAVQVGVGAATREGVIVVGSRAVPGFTPVLSAAAGVAGEDLAVAAAVRVGLRQAGASGSSALVRTGGGALVRVGSGQLGTAMLGLAGGSASQLALPAVVTGVVGAESAAPRAIALNALNPTFRATPRSVFQAMVDRAMGRIIANPSSELRALLGESNYMAGQASARVARMNFGKAVQVAIADEIRRSRVLRQAFAPTGVGNIWDFTGIGEFNGYFFEVTTQRGVWSHYYGSTRFYGGFVEYGTYIRPAGLKVFPP